MAKHLPTMIFLSFSSAHFHRQRRSCTRRHRNNIAFFLKRGRPKGSERKIKETPLSETFEFTKGTTPLPGPGKFTPAVRDGVANFSRPRD
mmetsp:Transcript_15828/g.35642  ORF Transcript_15828/g.35642 Transcript_15828/m.35642 type:complete len:90 (-) Transcript_15828:369-638(-)